MCLYFAVCCDCIGLESKGVCALAPARFTVETFSAGRGEITIQVLNDDGTTEEVTSHNSNSITLLQINNFSIDNLKAYHNMWFYKLISFDIVNAHSCDTPMTIEVFHIYW